MSGRFVIQAHVTPNVRAYVRAEAAREQVSVSAMAATLLREAIDMRARERNRIAREFQFPSLPWPTSGTLSNGGFLPPFGAPKV